MLHYLCTADQSIIFSQLRQYLSSLNIFLYGFCPVEKCGVSPHCSFPLFTTQIERLSSRIVQIYYKLSKNLRQRKTLVSLLFYLQWTLSNSNSQGEFEFVRIMESSD